MATNNTTQRIIREDLLRIESSEVEGGDWEYFFEYEEQPVDVNNRGSLMPYMSPPLAFVVYRVRKEKL